MKTIINKVKKTEEQFQSYIYPNSKTYQLKSPNISECIILNKNNELQFRIEHYQSSSIKQMIQNNNNNNSDNQQPPIGLVYYIEFERSELKGSNLILSDEDEKGVSFSKIFFIKKEKDVQVSGIYYVRIRELFI